VEIKKWKSKCSTEEERRPVIVNDLPGGERQGCLDLTTHSHNPQSRFLKSLEDSVLDEVIDDVFDPDGNNMGFILSTGEFALYFQHRLRRRATIASNYLEMSYSSLCKVLQVLHLQASTIWRKIPTKIGGDFTRRLKILSFVYCKVCRPTGCLELKKFSQRSGYDQRNSDNRR
jgi:hypothetical protein